ncbi:MAG: uroporphyrinogen-III synthase [Pseudomonadales bacterium]|nr:uroporphyrinogen-III synthase [Pseudomonadales bacterium]
MTHWITYSEPSANRLSAQLQRLGQAALCESVTQIKPLTLADPFPAERPDLIIALSQHAVAAYLDRYFNSSHQGAVTLAIGKTTAARLIEHGALQVHLPQMANSEGLLAMPQVQTLQPSQRVWLLTGEGGRDLVVHALAQRCQLQRFSLYRREKRQLTLPIGFQPKAIWVGSIHGLQQVDAASEPLKINRQTTMLVAASNRVAHYARQRNWTKILICEPSDIDAVKDACARIDHDR